MLMAAASGNTYKALTTETASKKRSTHFSDSTNSCKHEFDAEGICTCLQLSTDEERINAPKIQLNKEAATYAAAHLKDNGFYYDKIKNKSISTLKMIDKVFTSYNIPVELKYLAVVESKLDYRIVSTVGAAGLWQFMPGAAKSFGLKINGKTDERRNNYKSTVAAAKCLIYLHKIFDDWLLTIAAYNCGPGRVLSAIKKSGSRDFWVIENYLPAETRKHVKKFISVHYHFEGHGSLVTMTKKETMMHADAVTTYFASFQNQADSSAENSNTVVEITPAK